MPKQSFQISMIGRKMVQTGENAYFRDWFDSFEIPRCTINLSKSRRGEDLEILEQKGLSKSNSTRPID